MGRGDALPTLARAGKTACAVRGAVNCAVRCAVACALSFASCQTLPETPRDGVSRTDAAAPLPPGAFTFELATRDADFEAAAAELAPLVAGQFERTSRLGHLESRASFELRGEVVDGGFEQCEGDVFLAPGGRGAVRLTKLGDNLAWIGGDAERSWVFTFRDGRCDARVYVRLVSAEAPATPGTELTPESVRVLSGLAALPREMLLARIPGASATGSVRERFELRWPLGARITAALRFGPDGLPAGVVLRRDGVEVARSETSDYVRARMDAVAEGAWPFVPRRIRILAPRSGADLRVFLDAPAAQSKRMKQRFFDLDALLTQFMPASVEYVERDGSGEGSGGDVPSAGPAPEAGRP